MEKNLLVTGSPGCGKTTVLLRLSEMLRNRGHVVGGIICPEIRQGGIRQGFEIVDLLGRRGILAHVSLASSGAPLISRYGVNLRDLDEISREAFSRQAEVFLVDEIGPMELKSSVFASGVWRKLESKTPVAAAVHFRTSAGFIARVKGRSDTRLVVVTAQNRDGLPDLMYQQLVQCLGPGK